MRGFGAVETYPWCAFPGSVSQSQPYADAIPWVISTVQYVLGVPQTGRWDAETQATYLEKLKQVISEATGSESEFNRAIETIGSTPVGMAQEIIVNMIFPDDEMTFKAFSRPFMKALGIPTSSFEECRMNIVNSGMYNARNGDCVGFANALVMAIMEGLTTPEAEIPPLVTVTPVVEEEQPPVPEKAGFNWSWVLGIGALGVLGYLVFKGE